MHIAPKRSVLMIIAGIDFVGYALMIVGCYRVITGKRADVAVEAADVSVIRVIVGLFAAILSLVIPLLIAFGILEGMFRLGLDPRVFFDK